MNALTNPTQHSRRAAVRLRQFRKTRRITAEQLAAGFTELGYPVSRSVLANYENGRFRTVPLDLVVTAMRYFDVSFTHFMTGPLCNGCDDKPPLNFMCRICKRTTNERGELVVC